MKPIIPNPKEPWKVCPKQLAELDNYIKHVLPAGTKLSEGVQYARWAEIPSNAQLVYVDGKNGIPPDNIFEGKIFGKEVTILMWLPFFNVVEPIQYANNELVKKMHGEIVEKYAPVFEKLAQS